MDAGRNDNDLRPDDPVEHYYRPPEHVFASAAPVEDDEHRPRSRHFPLGLALLIAAIPTQFLSCSVALFVSDPADTIEDSDYLDGDPSTVGEGGLETVLLASEPVRHVQALFSGIISALSILGLIAAIGLMRGKRLGRQLSSLWAVLALVYLVIDTTVAYLYVFPTYSGVEAQLLADCGVGCTHLLDSICGTSTSAEPAGFPVFQACFVVLPVVVLVATLRRPMVEGCVR